MTELKRDQDRYIVIKREGLSQRQLGALESTVTLSCLSVTPSVVVESDWPIYTGTCEAVERFSKGEEQLVDRLRRELNAANRECQRAEANLSQAKADAKKEASVAVLQNLNAALGRLKDPAVIESLEELLALELRRQVAEANNG